MVKYHYQISREGMGGFLCPPGDPHHTHSVRSSNGDDLMSLSSAVDCEWLPVGVVARVRKLLDDAHPVESSGWVEMIYGYFRNMWTSDGQTWGSTTDLISDSSGERPADHHAAVVWIRKWFPSHAPRVDLIANPGKGYGSWPCSKCGTPVQYEASVDALAVFAKRRSGGDICDKGGAHER